MTYELTKELKDAGFLQNLTLDEETCSKDANFVENVEKLGRDPAMHFPTLSELIEACGDDFWKLQKGTQWRAVAESVTEKDEEFDGLEETFALGETPDEAVARLWLALRKRKT